MDVTVRPSRVTGSARAPPSKSYTHRAILAAGYARNTRVRDALLSADTRATIRAVDAFGASVDREGDTLSIEGFDGRPSVPADVIDCANSGTTTRLVTACGALADGLTVLTGDESLRSRPQGPLLEAIEALDGRAASTRGNGQAPLVVGGPIDGGTVSIPGDVSSQYVSALLMAGGVTESGIDVELETALKSAPYVEITRAVLEEFSVETERTERGFTVPGGQSYDAPDTYAVPGDFSSISYLLAIGALAAEESIVVDGAHPSAQGDTAIVDTLGRMGATLEWDRSGGSIEIHRSTLEGVSVDVSDTPDLLPTYAVLGACAEGTTTIENCEHVRYKETDRVSAMADLLDTMGASVEEARDQLTIHGGESTLEGARLDGRGDHRIVMALAVAGLVATGETTITGAEHVDVSFPGFFEELEGIGVAIERSG